eukprot:5707866-Ditylum_brightwellii.AAC.1
MPCSGYGTRFPQEGLQDVEKYIQNICKPLVLGYQEWILRMIKLNDYLEFFPVPGGVTATKIAREEFVDILEDRVLYQRKLEFKKEGFDLSSSMLKEFLDMFVCLEEAELQKPLKKKIAPTIKEHDKSDNNETKLRHKTRHRQSKCYGRRILRQQNKHHGGKHRKKYCGYHGLCYHDTDKCDLAKSCKKHVQPTHRITEQQRLRQVRFVKDAKRHAKRHGLTGQEVKDLNTFVKDNVFIKDKINETIKERNHNMHAMSNFKDLSISSIDDSIKSIISDTSDEESDSDSCKPAHKK